MGVEIPVWAMLLAAAFSGSTVTALISGWYMRRERRATANKTDAEAEAIHLSNDTKRLLAISDSNKTIKEILEESEANVKKMRETNSQLVAAQSENEFLSKSLNNAKAIIDYQKTERHEWTEQLKNVLGELAEAKTEIEQLNKRVAELERINKELVKATGK